MAWRPSTATVTVVTIAIALVGNVATNTVSVDKTWTWWPTAVWTVVGVLVTAAVAIELLRQGDRDLPGGAAPPSAPDLQNVADRLAAVVRKQWRDEVARRSLNDPYPLPVSWEPAPPDLVSDWSDITRLAMHGAGWARIGHDAAWMGSTDDLFGADGDLVEVWRKVPTRRLVVLGDPGAGKTMLLVRFVVDLLESTARTSGDPVPVLVSIASWNPEIQHLRGWLTEHLAIDHPALNHKDAAGTSLFEALLDNRLIILVLDGLDEIPEPLRGLALAQVNQALDGGQPLLISSRTDAYRAATRPANGTEITLTGAAGIRLCPLDVDDVTSYLRGSTGGPSGEPRWNSVAESMSAGGLLADVLTTPLMTTLARAIYNPAPGNGTTAGLPDPAELLDLPDRRAVEQHLFDGFVPASYRHHPTRRSRWEPEDAAKWLSYLAFHLEHDRLGSPSLAWWHLHLRTVPRAPSKALVIVVCGALALIAGVAAGLLYSTAYSQDIVWDLAPRVAISAVLVLGTVLWLTGRYDAVLSAGVAVAISSGLAIDLGGDLTIQAGGPVTLVVAVGLAVGFVYPLKPDPPGAIKAGAVVATAALVLYCSIYSTVRSFPMALYLASTEGVLTGLLVVVATTLATRTIGRSTSIARWSAVVLTVALIASLTVWWSSGDVLIALRNGLQTGLAVALIIVVLVGLVRSSGPTLPARWAGPAIALLVILSFATSQIRSTGLNDVLLVAVLTVLALLAALATSRHGRQKHPAWAPLDARDWLTKPTFAGLGSGFVHGVYYAPAYGLAVGLAVGLTVELVARQLTTDSPAQSLRFALKGLALGAAVCAAVSVLLTTRGFSPPQAGLLGVIVGVAAGLTYGMDVPRGITAVRSPRQVLARDRAAFLICSAGVAAAVTVAVGFVAGMGREFNLPSALVGGVLYGVPTGALVAASRTQWLHYTLNRLVLAIRGHAPRDLMAFLDDAHTVHGVLRQDGATYQFRHLDMQRRLAATYRCAAPGLELVVPRAPAVRSEQHHVHDDGS